MSGDFDVRKVYINTKAYKARRLQPSLVSQWPSKVVTGGDVTQDSHPYLSSWARLQDNVGGLGLFKQGSGDPTNMVWDATGETRFRGQFGRRPKQNSVQNSFTTYSDNFNRANGAIGTSSSGHAWTEYVGTWLVSSNYGTTSTKGTALAGFDISAPDIDASVTVDRTTTPINGYIGLFFRYDSSGDNYFVAAMDCSNGNTKLISVAAGVPSVVDTYASTGTSATIRVLARGSSISIYVDGTLRISYTSTSLVDQTKHGIYNSNNAAGYGLWDNFSLVASPNQVITGIAHNYSGSQRAYFVTSGSQTYVDNTSTGSNTLTFVRSLAAAPTVLLEFIPSVAGSVTDDSTKNMLYIAQGRYVDRTEAGTSWTREDLGTDGLANHLAIWDGKLWRLSNKGALFSSTAGHGSGGGGWTASATGAGMGLDGTYHYATSLFPAKDAAGDVQLWMTTNTALYRLDATTPEWVGPIVSFPRSTNSGKGSCEWKDKIYIPVELDVIRVTPGTPTTIENIGPVRFDGLPAKCEGAITRLTPTFHFLAASITHSSASGATEPRLLAYTGDDGGWHTVGLTTLSAQTGTSPSTSFIVDSWSEHRLYFTFQSDTNLYYVRLYPGVENPRRNPTQSFETSTQYAYKPWFNGSKEGLKKLALRMVVRTSGCDATDYIRVSYGTDLSSDSTWTTLATITSNGRQELEFDVSGDGLTEGLAFDYIRFRFEVIGATASANPLLEYCEFDYLQSLPPSWAHRVELQLDEDVEGRSPQEQFDELRALADPTVTTALVKLSWDSAAASPNIYMVRLHQLQALEQGLGADPRGRYLAVLLEPVA